VPHEVLTQLWSDATKHHLFSKGIFEEYFLYKSLTRNGARCNEAQRKNRAKGERSMR